MIKRPFVSVILGIVSVVLAVVVAVLSLYEPQRVSVWKRKADAFDQRCSLIRIASESQRLELQLPDQREAIMKRMEQELSHWRPNDLDMCTGGSVDLRRRSTCVIDRDVTCLIALSQEIESEISKWVK